MFNSNKPYHNSQVNMSSEWGVEEGLWLRVSFHRHRVHAGEIFFSEERNIKNISTSDGSSLMF